MGTACCGVPYPDSADVAEDQKGGEMMTPWLRIHADLAEDPSSVPSTHIMQLTAVPPAPGDRESPSDLSEYLHSQAQILKKEME